MKIDEWILLYENLMSKLKTNKNHILKLNRNERQKILEATDELREKFIHTIISDQILIEAKNWVSILIDKINSLKENGIIEGVTLAREFRSFLEDPIAHLKKKIFIYTFNLISGNLSLIDFIDRAGAAIRTSLRTNMRSTYQTWIFLVLISKLIENNGRIVYPEHGYIYIERNARQKIGILPPNCIVEFNGGKRLSLFIEVPRPLSWHDSSDLRKVWKFYVALRPDFMIYGGSQMNIAEPENSPPIKRPNIIIECKELSDWYKRVRDLRGWWTKALSAEEWRMLWLKGLWEGLADAMGVKAKDKLVKEVSIERRGLRMKEYKLVQIYKKFYNPDSMILITRTKIPNEIKCDIENSGLIVYDNIEFNEEKLTEAVNLLKKYGKATYRSKNLIDIIKEKYQLNFEDKIIEKAILSLIEEHFEDFMKKMEE